MARYPTLENSEREPSLAFEGKSAFAYMQSLSQSCFSPRLYMITITIIAFWICFFGCIYEAKTANNVRGAFFLVSLFWFDPFINFIQTREIQRKERKREKETKNQACL